MKLVVLIPAYNPGPDLVDYVRELSASGFNSVIIVDDGSSAKYRGVFEKLKHLPAITLLRHAVNLGKGMALKTGLNHAFVTHDDILGAITADADGQHHIDDVRKTASLFLENPHHLIIGVRQFGADTPLRSRFGNGLTQLLYRLVIGVRLTDTQSGLRAIPRDLIPKLLKISSNGYEFELDTLIACHHSHRRIVEQPIKTIYIEGNRSSHFNPIVDSMKVYFVLFRSILVSLMTVTIDTLIFIPLFHSTDRLLMSQFTARLIGMVFQYTMVKRLVFYSDKKHMETFPPFAFSVVALGFVSYGLIRLQASQLHVGIVQAKIAAEALMYLIGFTIQRDFIFTRRKGYAN